MTGEEFLFHDVLEDLLTPTDKLNEVTEDRQEVRRHCCYRLQYVVHFRPSTLFFRRSLTLFGHMVALAVHQSSEFVSHFPYE